MTEIFIVLLHRAEFSGVASITTPAKLYEHTVYFATAASQLVMGAKGKRIRNG